MTDPIRSDIQISGTTATWEMRLEGEISGTYTGVFKFRTYLTPLQSIGANREYRELLGVNPLSAPEHESFLCYALCQLKYRVIEAPPFWSATLQSSTMAGNIPDESIISSVLEAAINAETMYKNQLQERKLAALKVANAEVEAIVKAQNEGNKA